MCEKMTPLYTIKGYTDEIYKVIEFKCDRNPDRIKAVRKPESEWEVNDTKLSQSISRARSMVLQYALCNEWDWFITLTLNGDLWKRDDLTRYKSALMQWVRDLRKSYQSDIQLLLVPERHGDGCWHMHGLVRGIPDNRVEDFPAGVPLKLVLGGFKNWPDYQRKFGFCSLGRIGSHEAVSFYILKYIAKGFADDIADFGRHLYIHTRGLKTAQDLVDIYNHVSDLSSVCCNDFKYVKTGFALDRSWDWPLCFDGDYHFEPWQVPTYDDGIENVYEPEYEQLKLGGVV